MDKIHIRDLLLRCVIGVYERERDHKQDVVLNIVLHTDISRAGQSDDLNDTVDYKALRDRICAFVEDSACFLLERLAEGVAQVCLATPSVCRVEVTVDKPGALTYARSVAVEICREKQAGR